MHMIYLLIIATTLLQTHDFEQVLNKYHQVHQEAVLDAEIILKMYQENSNKNNRAIIENLTTIRNKVMAVHFETGRIITPSNLNTIDESVQTFFISIDNVIATLSYDLQNDKTGFFQQLPKEEQMRYKFLALGLQEPFSRFQKLKEREEQ